MPTTSPATVAAPSFVVVEDTPAVALYDVYSYRADRDPQSVIRHPVTLAQAREIVALLHSDPYRIPDSLEIVPAGERPATMPELLAQLHELQDLVADLQTTIASLTEER